MNITIVTPFRPSTGGMNSGGGPLTQDTIYRWVGPNGQLVGQQPNDPNYLIEYIAKNSVGNHKILIVIDSDMTPREGWLSQYPNVQVVQDPYVCTETRYEPNLRASSAIQYGVSLVPDEEWCATGWIADAYPCRSWDAGLDGAVAKYGEKNVFIPCFCEVVGTGVNRVFDPAPATPDKIWNEWRRTICCHALTIPYPEKKFITYEDFEAWCDIARSGRPSYVVEPCGMRDYGYFSSMIMKAKWFKNTPRRVGSGWETEFDGALYEKHGLMKVVMTDSFLLHPAFIEFRH